MRVNIAVRIDTEPGDNNNHQYGSMNFAEEAVFAGAGFTTVARIFARCHELLHELKQDHDRSEKK